MMTSIPAKTSSLVSIILSLLLIGSAFAPSATYAAAPSASRSIPSSGSIDLSGVISVDFENDDCFKWGIDGNGTGYMLYGTKYDDTAPYWTRGSWPASKYPSLMLFESDTTTVHRGLSSARLSVVDTSMDGYRRIEVLHDWDPHSQYLWEVAWYYFPSSLRPLDSWVAFHRIVYERMWDQNKAVYYQMFQITLSATTDGRSATLGQQIFVLNLGKGEVDNNNDGTTETWPYMETDIFSNGDSSPQTVPSSWMTRNPALQIPFDRWFKINTLVFRNTTDFNNGYIKVWIDDELIWDIRGTRTVGIDPAILESIDPLPPEPQGYLSSGYGLYTGIGSSPKEIFVDDVIISNSPWN